MDATAQPVRLEPARKDPFFGHPSGLGYLSFTVGWIEFSFYGMQALLVLYMSDQLLKPGHIEHVLGFTTFRAGLGLLYGSLAGQRLASAILGLYSALIYATPILGGLIADRLLGRTRTIILGGVLLTVGHFLMAFEASFLIALSCLIAGMGCAGSLKAQVGGLYAPDDLRRADAFQLYTLAVQIAVFGAPLICGTLGETYAWHWGFMAAGVGMLFGLAIYLYGRRTLPPERPLQRGAGAARDRLTRTEWKTVGVLALLLPVMALASVGNMEIFNGYLIWGKQTYALEFFGKTMPVTWLISLDSIVSTVTLLASLMFWRAWGARRRQPDEIVKMAIGAAICATAPLLLALASQHAAGGHKVGLVWGVGFHTLNDIGFANLYAVGLALFSRAAPPSLGATIVNAFSLHLFLANLLVGYLAGLLAVMPPAQFWLMHAALIAAAAGVMAVFARLFRHNLAPRSEAER